MKGSRFREIIALAAPIIAGLGSQNIMHIADTIMIGHLNTASLAAVGVAGMALWVAASLFQGFSHGVQAMTARRLGEGADDRLHEAVVNAFYCVIALGVPVSLVFSLFAHDLFRWFSTDPEVQAIGGDYLAIRLLSVVFVGLNFCFRGYFNGRQRSLLFMQTLLIVHPLNILLNYLLIYGAWGAPRLEAEGAAIGTLIATALGSANYFRVMLRHKNPGFSLRPKVVSRITMRTLISLAIPSCGQYLAMSASFLAFFVITGMVGTQEQAAANVLVNLTRICLLFSLGLGMATITLVGSALGDRNPELAKNWVRWVSGIAAVVLGVIGLAIAATPRFTMGLFGVEQGVVAVAIVPMMLLGFSQIYDAVGVILSYAHLGGGAARRVFLITVINQWLLFIPACYVAVLLGGGLTALWGCMVGYRLLLALSFWVSLRDGQWLRIAV